MTFQISGLSVLPIENLGRFSGDIATVTPEESLAATLKLLVSKNVYSVPVYSKATNAYVAIVEVGDLVATLIDLYKELETSIDLHHLPQRLEERWNALTVQFLLSHPGRHEPFQPLKENNSVQDAINGLGKSGRRIPIVDSQGKVVQIVSPFSVINFFGHQLDVLPDEVKHKTIKQLGRYSKHPIVVDCDTKAIDTFAKMVQSGVTGLGIRSREHDIMAVISIKDIKVAAENLATLTLPVDEYIQIVRRANLRAIAPSIYCSIDDTFEKVVAKLAAIRMHRVFLHGEDHHSTVGVLSVWDLVSLFVQ